MSRKHPLVVVLFDARDWSLHRIAKQLLTHWSDPAQPLCDVRAGNLKAFESNELLPARDLKRVAAIVCLWHGDAERAFKRVPPWTRRVVCVYDCGTYWGSALENAVQVADAVGYCAPSVRRNLIRRWPFLESKLAPCTDGVDATRQFVPMPWPANHAANRLRVGWCGSTDVHGPFLKGVHLIEEAAKQANQWLTLVLVDRALPFEKMRDKFYAAIDVYVCMSSEEGTPNPLLEAAACGRPFVSSDVGIASTLIDDARCIRTPAPPGVVLSERSVPHLLRALQHYRDHRALLQAAGAAARATIEQCGWDWTVRSRQLFDALVVNG